MLFLQSELVVEASSCLPFQVHQECRAVASWVIFIVVPLVVSRHLYAKAQLQPCFLEVGRHFKVCMGEKVNSTPH